MVDDVLRLWAFVTLVGVVTLVGATDVTAGQIEIEPSGSSLGSGLEFRVSRENKNSDNFG